MKTLKISVVALALLTLALQGCLAAAGAGAGAVGQKYASGSLETTYSANLDQTVKATQTAMTQSQIQVTEVSADSTKAQIRGTRSSDGAPVSIDLSPSGSTTKAKIRVGTIGDEDAARVLNEKIVKNLK